MSPGTAQQHSIGTHARLEGPGGVVTLPVEIDASMMDGVVWVPMNSEGCRVYRDLGVGYGHTVRITGGGTT
jgi:NADH-quinone oxidoreductase subunit G